MDFQVPSISLGTLLCCSIERTDEMKTHNKVGIRLCGITEELESSKLPFTTCRQEYRADANSAVGGIT
jgi:hypothetical protein